MLQEMEAGLSTCVWDAIGAFIRNEEYNEVHDEEWPIPVEDSPFRESVPWRCGICEVEEGTMILTILDGGCDVQGKPLWLVRWISEAQMPDSVITHAELSKFAAQRQLLEDFKNRWEL